MKLNNLIFITITFLLCLIYIFIDFDPNILFIGNLFICFMICMKAKISLFSLKILLIFYVLIAIFFQYNFGKSYGILQFYNGQLHYTEMNILALIYGFLLYIFINATNILKYEQEKKERNYKLSKICGYFCGICAMIFAIVAFPRLGYVSSASLRFNSLLPGNAWNHVCIIFLILAIPNFRTSKFVKFSYLFCIIWFLLNGERVDIVGLLICLFIIFFTKDVRSKIKKSLKLYTKYIFLIIAIVFLMVFIGEKRSNSDISLSSLCKKILVQNTAADIGYVYESSVRYPEEYGYFYGKTYVSYLTDLIPLSSSKYNASRILSTTYSAPGGILILSEPYMNFGYIGIIIFSIFEFLILYFILKKKSKYSYFLYLFLIAASFRISWYGLSYAETGIVYILPILYILISILNKRMVKYEK